MDGAVAWSGCLMGFRNRLRSAAIQSAGALHLDELMRGGFHAGGFMHAVNFHGTPVARRETFIRQLEWLRSRFTPKTRCSALPLLT